ncbi:hypothetical protein ACFU6I_39585 [Streptomyces sp. NPDC057486]|uniref:hypothetical protein n=1 Tax=Streptomyces sp. NPDC057486 TaxID=3346145 RepID=UPI0036C15CE4
MSGRPRRRLGALLTRFLAPATRMNPQLETPPDGDLWALRPAAEQLDSIAG